VLLQTLSTLSLIAAPPVGEPENRFVAGVVVAVERSRIGSGYLEAWHRIEIRPPAAPNLTLSVLSLSADEVLPAPGQVCLFRYHTSGLEHVRGRAIVDTMSCDPVDSASAS